MGFIWSWLNGRVAAPISTLACEGFVNFEVNKEVIGNGYPIIWFIVLLYLVGDGQWLAEESALFSN